MSSPVGGEEYKAKGKKLRELLLGKVNLMYEGELTVEQRESRVAVGVKDGKPTYRMYRFICEECGFKTVKLPYSEMQLQAYTHYNNTKHKPLREQGGVFFKEDLYHE